MFLKFTIPTLNMGQEDFLQLQHELVQKGYGLTTFQFVMSSHNSIHFEVIQDEAEKEGYVLVAKILHHSNRSKPVVNTNTYGRLTLEKKIDLSQDSLYDQVVFLRELASEYGGEVIEVEVVGASFFVSGADD